MARALRLRPVMNPMPPHLRFVEADWLDTSAGRLDDVVVVSPTRAPLGKLSGVLFDVDQLRVHAYVVECRGWFTSRHYSLPVHPARLAGDAHTLEVGVDPDDLASFDRIDPASVPKFSDEDLVAVMFRSRAA